MEFIVCISSRGVPQDLESCWVCREWQKVAEHLSR